MRISALHVLTLVVVVAAGAVWWVAWHHEPPSEPEPVVVVQAPVEQSPPLPYEEWARREFLENHPGEKPLNWEIAQAAEGFYQSMPMGGFTLHANDCSDFADSVLDEALGAKARFNRRSPYHVVSIDGTLWDFFYWNGEEPLQAGDEINVQHSPHYAPFNGATRHCGIIGTDGNVYDWTKIRSWSTSRYGCYTINYFTRHCHSDRDVIIRRMKPQFRYLIEPVPIRYELARRVNVSR